MSDADQPSRTAGCIDDVLITDDLGRRPSRAPDHEAENRALAALAQDMTANPAGVLQKLALLVIELRRADTAGISILEPGGANGIFRWRAAAGAFAADLGGTMPWDASPCGTVIERDAVLLFDNAERCFPALRGVEPPIYEHLLAPWHVQGEAIGTVWAIAHSPERRFDAEDARLLQSLARFASAAHQMTSALDQAKAARDELERRVAERTRALCAANERLEREAAERTRSQEALRASEARLRTALEIETVGVIYSTWGAGSPTPTTPSLR